MIKQIEERDNFTIKKKGDDVCGYKSHERNGFLVSEDIIGLDANVLVDMVESGEFKEDIRQQVKLNVLKICTTNVALGEARHVLVKKRGYEYDKATDALNSLIKEFNIQTIAHKPEFNLVAEQWVNILKKQMHIKKFKTFPNDCRILANLHYQLGMNLYITEDIDLEKAVKRLNLPLRVKIIGEASNLSGRRINEFFKGTRRSSRRK